MKFRSSSPPDALGGREETGAASTPGSAVVTDALDVASLDRTAVATAQLVMSSHANRTASQNTEDIVAIYRFMLRDTAATPGLRIYETPRAAATYLHGFRLTENRAEVCQDPECPGGDLGPVEAWTTVAGAQVAAPDMFALSTTRYVMGYHPSPDEAVETLAVYEWIAAARRVEAEIMPEPTTGADRNNNRIDHGKAASALLHQLRSAAGRDLPCLHCSDQSGGTVGTVADGLVGDLSRGPGPDVAGVQLGASVEPHPATESASQVSNAIEELVEELAADVDKRVVEMSDDLADEAMTDLLGDNLMFDLAALMAREDEVSTMLDHIIDLSDIPEFNV